MSPFLLLFFFLFPLESQGQLPLKYDLTWFDDIHEETRPLPPTPSSPNYPPEEDPKNAKLLKQFTAACKQTPTCYHHTGMERINCVRKCVSPSCYAEIYASDPIEEGEIDVRYVTFKRCFYDKKSKNISS